MNFETRKRAANLLMTSSKIVGNEHYLPKVYIVDKSIYLFLNAARRAAYCEKKHIETLTLEEASIFLTNKPLSTKLKRQIASLDQTGGVYGAYLFSDSNIKLNSPDIIQYENQLNV